MRRKKIRLRLSESRQKIIQEHLFFGDKNIKPESQAPVDGGLLHLANKPRKKPIKLKSANVVAYLSGTMSGGGAGGERRLPLVDRLNKVQADMTAALHAIAFPPPDKKKKNSVSFRNGLSAQSSNSSMDTFSPRPPGEPDGADDGKKRFFVILLFS